MSAFARVALDFFPQKDFDYRIPSGLKDRISFGARVRVPFGNLHKDGTVVGLHAEAAVAADKMRDVLDVLDQPALSKGTLQELILWVHRYYGGALGAAMRCAMPSAVRKTPKRRRTVLKSGLSDEIVFFAPKPVLSKAQAAVVSGLEALLPKGFHCALLHGVTGSGKTEVYLRLIEKVLAQGKGALVLVPEISLTPQAIDRFRSRFSQPVAVLHSGLSDGERRDQWRMIERGEASIVVGARSAVFAPLPRLGLIVVDEEQERSFKQQEAPHYHARDVAIVRAKFDKALVLLGSATPALETYHNACQGKYALLELPDRVDSRPMPRIEIHDMQNERTKEGKVPILSQRLVSMIENRLSRKEQVMLFLNRRGFHRLMWCDRCAKGLSCPDCSITLTHHRAGKKLMCHLCGRTQSVPTKCVDCNGGLLTPQGFGTQRVEAMLRKRFAGARIARMDADTTGTKGAHRDILSRFALGHFDMLLGTQMIAKGHDFPNVTLVGVLNADMGLNVPDFRAAETTFALLTQVAGRAGRGSVGGEVLVQTHVPDHFVMRSVREGDFKAFYEGEMALRQELRYPPQGHLILVCVKHKQDLAAKAAVEILQAGLAKSLGRHAQVLGCTPAPLQRAKGLHRWQVLIKTGHVLHCQATIAAWLAAHAADLGPGTLLDVDVDPQVLN